MVPKVAIIGAGSGMFSLSLIKDICLTPELCGSTITLMDINADRLAAVFEVCSRYAQEAGAALRLEQTNDRHAALEGADFVINTALAAGHARWRAGWSMAKDHGYRFGGSFHVMHDEAFWVNFYQLRLMESILQDILVDCPNAWYILIANPVMAGVTYLTRKYPRSKIVGLCHGYQCVYTLTDAMGLDRKDVTYEIPGVNHFVWLTKFRYRGEDAFPLVDAWIEKRAQDYWSQCPTSDYLGPKAVDLYRRFKAFPIGDTCTPGGGAWGSWYHTDANTQHRWREDPDDWWNRYFRDTQSAVVDLRNAAANSSQSMKSVFGAEPSEETMIPLIVSLAKDIPRVLIVNVPNTALSMPGIPQNFAVEIPALVSGSGIQGIQTEGLPTPLLAHALRDRVAPVEMELDAYVNRNFEALLELIIMDPWTRSEAQALDLLDTILELPYHGEMRDHYRRSIRLKKTRAALPQSAHKK